MSWIYLTVFSLFLTNKTAFACLNVKQCKCLKFSLSCDSANFTEIPPGIPADLQHLDFHNGELETVEADKLEHLLDLLELTMDKNKIVEVENGTFDNLVQLQKVSFNENHISYLMPGIFFNLQNLKYLLLSGNFLTSIEGLFNGLQELESLNLDNNLITQITADTFKDLPKLYDLQLNNNNIKDIHSDTFTHVPVLMVLGLGSNPISSLDDAFVVNSNLHYINLTDCNFTTFPAKLSSSLKYLKLGKNHISHIHKNETTRYTYLRKLMIEENQLQFIEEDALIAMSNLTDIYLVVNNLTTMPSRFPSSVKYIHLDSNSISSIPQNTFGPQTNLQLLSLRSNNIGTFDISSFINVASIHELKLDRNPLKILHDNIFLQLSGLQHLSLNGLHIHEVYPNCFLGLDSLQVLEMSHVVLKTAQNILGNFLLQVPTLQSLNLRNSPVLAHYFLSHETIMETVTNLTELNLAENGLTTIPPTMTWHLPYLQKLHLASNPFHCTEHNFWLKEWYHMEPDLFEDMDKVFCHTPPDVQGKLLKDVELIDFYKDEHNASIDQTDNNTMDIMTTEESYYDFYDTTMPQYHDDDEYNDSYYHFPYDNDYDPYDSYDFLTYSTVIVTTDTEHTETTHNGTLATDLATPKPTTFVTKKMPGHESSGGPSNFRSIALAVSMAFGVILIMLLIAGVIYCKCGKRNGNVVHHNARQNNGTNDYVFIVSKTDIQTETETSKPTTRLSRKERGSTTSQASEDITNDTSLKVYTIEMDK